MAAAHPKGRRLQKKETESKKERRERHGYREQRDLANEEKQEKNKDEMAMRVYMSIPHLNHR